RQHRMRPGPFSEARQARRIGLQRTHRKAGARQRVLPHKRRRALVGIEQDTPQPGRDRAGIAAEQEQGRGEHESGKRPDGERPALKIHLLSLLARARILTRVIAEDWRTGNGAARWRDGARADSRRDPPRPLSDTRISNRSDRLTFWNHATFMPFSIS